MVLFFALLICCAIATYLSYNKWAGRWEEQKLKVEAGENEDEFLEENEDEFLEVAPDFNGFSNGIRMTVAPANCTIELSDCESISDEGDSIPDGGPVPENRESFFEA